MGKRDESDDWLVEVNAWARLLSVDMFCKWGGVCLEGFRW